LANAFQVGDEFERADVFGVLVTELRLDAQSQRRAVVDGQRAIVQFVREDRLWVNGVDQVDAFVVGVAVVVGVHAAKDDVFRVGFGFDPLYDLYQPHAFPFADDAPAFDAIVARDLRARRHGFQFFERKTCRLFDQTGDFQTPFRPVTLRVGGIVHSDRRRIAVGAKGG